MSGATVVVGFGLTGRAVAAYERSESRDVVVVDDAPAADAAAVAGSLGVRLVGSPDAAALHDALRGADTVVPSPGIPVGHPALVAAGLAGLPVVSEIELAWRRLAAAGGSGPALVAVTGTNGKTTVAVQVADMLRASGVAAVTAGNIGTPLLDAVLTPARVVVAEVSSFQLQFTSTWHPRVSCWLNLAEDHLDWHPDLGHYAAAKSRVWTNQVAGDTAVVNVDDTVVLEHSARIPAGVAVVGFGTAGGAVWRDVSPAAAAGDAALARLLDPRGADVMAGGRLVRALPHDRLNALAAAAVATAAGATPEGVAAALSAWRPLDHRVQLVAERDGIRWYDDSKATTPASVLAAATALGPAVLIAGGRNKGLDLRPLRGCVPPVHAVVAIGEAAAEVAGAFAGLVPVVPAADMGAAVAAARSLACSGDAVVLSPGCASFDRYRSYAERGAHFSAEVDRLLSGTPSRPTDLPEEHRQ